MHAEGWLSASHCATLRQDRHVQGRRQSASYADADVMPPFSPYAAELRRCRAIFA